MRPERWKRANELFHAARERQRGERDAFLAEACADDPSLQAEVLSLIAAEEEAGSFIDTPAVHIERAVEAETLARGQPGPSGAAPADAGHLQPAGDLGLRTIPQELYAIEREIARGGMGRILAARDRRLGRPVVIKELLPGGSDLAGRFEREALMTARLQHPGIVNVHEAGRWPSGEPFYVMKMVSGRSLDRVVAEARGLDERLALLPNVIAAAEALAFAHDQRVIHRDLKPANVIIGAFGETVVIDWGLAKDLAEAAPGSAGAAAGSFANDAPDGQTVAGTIMGTPAFMAPEQARGEAVHERADVYALGAILYYVLAGGPPYTGGSSAEVLRRVLEGPPVPLGQRQPEAPPDLLAIVGKAMAPRAGNRYPTAKELAEDLKRFQTGQLVGAHRYTTGQLVRRWLRRHRAPVAVAAVLLGLLALTAVLSFERVVREREIAETRADELVLTQARNALGRDPTEALAWLKQYSLGASNWSAARTIAADALGRGVAEKVWRHEGVVFRIAFSPDGRLLASGGVDWTVRLRSLATGELRSFIGHEWYVNDVAFSPDGRWLASVGGKMLWLWDVETGQGRVERDLFADGVTFLPNGTLAAIGLKRGGGLFVFLWDPESGVQRRIADPQDTTELDSSYAALAASSDGRWLAAQIDAKVHLWDLEAGRKQTWPAEGGVAFSPDGKLLVWGNPDHSLAVHGVSGGRPRRFVGHQERVKSVAFSPHGAHIVSSGADGTVRLWDAGQGSGRVLHRHDGLVWSVVFAPDGRTVASGGDDHMVRVWDLGSGTSRTLEGHADVTRALAFSPDGRRLASASADGEIRVWRLQAEGFEDLTPPEAALASKEFRVAWAPDGSRYAASAGPLIRLWDAATHQVRLLRGHAADVTRLVFSADSQMLASASEDKAVRLWDTATGAGRVLEGHEDPVWDVAFSPDGRQLASASGDMTIRLWDLANRRDRVLRGHEFPVGRVTFAPDGRRLASASMPYRRDRGQLDFTVRLWDVGTGRPTAWAGHTSTVVDVAFSPDGRTIASGSMDRAVRLWREGRSQVLGEHGSVVTSVAFSPDGRWLVSGSDDGTARLWDLTDGTSRVLPAAGGINCTAVFSPDGATLATQRFTTKLWDVATGESRVLPGVRSNAAFSPDSRRVLTVLRGGVVRVWRDDLPRDPTALRAWLESVTDNTIGGGRQ